ncbi:hypothetical protein SAMN05443634_111125 [Chishuiella changwenlii]|uniref:Uncharacterized protein n=1 Tax=Chishuiella changwenlii TaxID=1434701 RepID=A0A1M7BSK7_9FLAO|nr:hypothetical protein [Chishuiella changwenlii]GGF03565.1 hypothetical protein GCM10010984_21180 [Chishuiella changwenlii]SHL57927.1 hypothetical protein SAMN05443634_111125 [Chishuiella changwenlii]
MNIYKFLVIAVFLISTNSFSQEKAVIKFYGLNNILPLGKDTIYSKYSKNIEKVSDKVYLFDKNIKIESLFPIIKGQPFYFKKIVENKLFNIDDLLNIEKEETIDNIFITDIGSFGTRKNKRYFNLSMNVNIRKKNKTGIYTNSLDIIIGISNKNSSPSDENSFFENAEITFFYCVSCDDNIMHLRLL